MLNISIVLYRPAWEREVIPLVKELLHIKNLRKIYLLDNTEPSYSPLDGPTAQAVLRQSGLTAKPSKVRYMPMTANLGYGKAHNIAIRESVFYRTDYHLVINSDIRVKAEQIEEMAAWMDAYPEVGQLMPRVVSEDGTPQYLAKRLPSPWDVAARRFIPGWQNTRRNKWYELRDKDLTHPINAPYLSGCFMLLRTQAVLEAGLFDERYFMYPEDIDLTRSIHRRWLTIYQPQWTIVHAHKRASYHSTRMLWIHIQNLCRYFNKYGWFFDKERWRMNKV